jgi:DNA modification methylase
MIELYHENCLEWLRQQPSDCFGGIVTDPPYHRQGDENLDSFLNQVLAECRRTSKGPVYFVCPIQWGFEKPHERRGWPTYNPLPDAAGGWQTMSKLNAGAAPILCWNGPSPGTFEIPLPDEAINGERSTVKPVGLFTRLIKLCKPGVICDPFLGWGSVARAAQYLERDFIGIENVRRIYEDARRELIPDSKEDKTTRDNSPGSFAVGKTEKT